MQLSEIKQNYHTGASVRLGKSTAEEVIGTPRSSTHSKPTLWAKRSIVVSRKTAIVEHLRLVERPSRILPCFVFVGAGKYAKDAAAHPAKKSASCVRADGSEREVSISELHSISFRRKHGASHRKKGGTRHTQVGNCRAPRQRTMFTKVNPRCINRFCHLLSDCDIER